MIMGVGVHSHGCVLVMGGYSHGCHGCGHFCRYTQNILMMYNQCITMDVVTISHIGVEGATIVMPLAGGTGGYHVTG